jgi:hypothetical protein
MEAMYSKVAKGGINQQAWMYNIRKEFKKEIFNQIKNKLGCVRKLSLQIIMNRMT